MKIPNLQEAKDRFLLNYIQGQANMAGYSGMMEKMMQVMALSKEANKQVDITLAVQMVDQAKGLLDELAKEYPEQAKGLEKGYAKLAMQKEELLALKPDNKVIKSK